MVQVKLLTVEPASHMGTSSSPGYSGSSSFLMCLAKQCKMNQVLVGDLEEAPASRP